MVELKINHVRSVSTGLQFIVISIMRGLSWLWRIEGVSNVKREENQCFFDYEGKTYVVEVKEVE